ncbi:histidine phosphatase superfamily-domain-containing protein [Mycena galopus ATCC 62051]|nr:histidine phosphatase superfamily-domain-containing protein [Mycena galopus ATCC 62051]
MDVKARSKAMREIVTRLVERANGAIEVKIFGDKVILDEDVENWPRCDVLISFFSTDFPLDKAISYVKLRNPFCINDLPLQVLLWDRRLVGAVLDHLKVPTPPRLEVSRDGGPRVENGLKDLVQARLGLTIGGFTVTPEVSLREDGNAIIIDGRVLEKPFVENLSVAKTTMYIKVYTVGQEYTHAETRKSPVVDGVVRRNTDGKEIRFITRLSEEEKTWAKKICEGFGQRVCGYDMLRCDNGQRSQVIDVNGWSFVKGNETYYDSGCSLYASVLVSRSAITAAESPTQEAPTWLLKANVTVFRHADRTPKQKLKFNFPIGEPWTQPFVTLLNGEKRRSFCAKKAAELHCHHAKLTQLSNALFSKIDLPGTKAQLKPVYSKRQAGQVRRLTKLTLVFKWGGEFTHSARYQSRDLGENMKKDISIMNKDALNNVKIFTSSERRVIASAEIFAAALVDSQNSSYSGPSSTPSSISSRYCFFAPSDNTDPDTPPDSHQSHVRKDLLDDSNAAKDLMDDVKKRLKILLRPGEPEKRPELTWPKSMNKEPVEVVKEVIELLSSFRKIMRKNFETMDVDKIQERWCCGDEPWLFRERWEKLFEDFCDVEQKKFDPSRVSELYDTLKYSALHMRPFLFAIFDEEASRDRKLHELYGRAKALFDLVAPQEYGIDPKEKEEIGILTSLPLLRNVVEDLEAARNHGESGVVLYFTKESHIHTLVNLVLQSGLPIANRRIPELDYCNHGRGKSDKEYSIRLSLSEGAHSSNVLDSTLDARHALNVQARRKLTQHLPYSLVIQKLSKHFHRLNDIDEDTGPDTPYETSLAPLIIVPGNDSSSDDP